MTCLRAARAQGVIPSSEDSLWGGLVPLSLLQQALIHRHDQVCMPLFLTVYLCCDTVYVLEILVFTNVLSFICLLLYYCISVASFPAVQVRMDGLGLVCENHRSTEVLTSQEMDLIQHFLPPNLNCQSPHVRQQTISLLKKVLPFEHITFSSIFT